jgi:protein SCO1
VNSLRAAVLAAALVAATGSLAPAAAELSNEVPSVGQLQELPGVSRTRVVYETPEVRLVRADGERVSLARELDDGRPVLLNFIFTTCSSVCPLASQTFAQFRDRLGTQVSGVHLMSISIDPEQDTPARLREYARKYHAGPEWQYYTGSLDASLAVQRAFDVYRGDKMSHTAVTLMRAAPGKPWLRIEGFVTPDDLVRDYRSLLAAR